MTDSPLTGHDLRVLRVAADVRTKDLAEAMGVLASTVSRLENSRRVTDKMRAKYVAALATFATPKAAA